jgi:hypothetical protein
MSRFVGVSFAVALLASIASTASAADTYPPGPSYRPTCTDSVTLFQVQQADTTLNPCYPLIGDTVKGIRGIITGFRLRSSGHIYMQNSNGSPYNAMMVFTVGHTESQGFAVGDSISVCGLMQAYQGMSQIQGSLGTSLTVRKISSGNPLPPYHVGTTSDFKWTPAAGAGSAFAHCDPLEGALVRINGPLKVARTQAGAGLNAGTNWLLVNQDGSFPGDSILIDGYTLPSLNISAPPLGAQVDRVQGILRRGINNGVDCWLISLLDVNDTIQPVPNLADAYPVAENRLRLMFDSNVDVTTAQNTANYTLGSAAGGSTVDLATVVGGSGNIVDLTITEALPRLSLESITSQGIKPATCTLPECASPQQSLSFVLGVLSCAEVQAPLADSLAGVSCLDKSRFAGSGSSSGARLTVRGVFVKQYGTLYFMADAAGGLRSGVAAYNVPFGMTVGHQYLLACRVQEYYGLTELSNLAALIDEGVVAVPAPQLQTVAVLDSATCDPLQSITNAEDYEGVLVKVQFVRVVPFNTDPQQPSQGGSFRVVAMCARADTILVSSLGNTYPDFTPAVGQLLDISGVLNIDIGVPRICPRSSADINEFFPPMDACLDLDVPPTAAPARVTFSVGPNPALIANVRFSLPRQADVDLSVFDLSGRRIVTLAKGALPASAYEYRWDGAGASAGVYFVRLRVGAENYSLRTVTLK